MQRYENVGQRHVGQSRADSIRRTTAAPRKSAQGSNEKSKSLSKGTVKWFSDEKGYGFITPEDGSKDLFIHHSNILGDGFKSLSEGQSVTYEAAEGRKGPEATSVQPS